MKKGRLLMLGIQRREGEKRAKQTERRERAGRGEKDREKKDY